MFRERGVGVRLARFLALPSVTLALSQNRFSAVVELFGVRFKTLLDVSLNAIRVVRVSQKQYSSQFEVVLADTGRTALTFVPAAPSQWLDAFAEAGVTVDDRTKGHFTANRLVHVHVMTITFVGLCFAGFVLLLLISIMVATAMKR